MLEKTSRSGLIVVVSAAIIAVAIFSFSLYLGAGDVPFLDRMIDFMAPLLEPFYRENERAIVGRPDPQSIVAAVAQLAKAAG